MDGRKERKSTSGPEKGRKREEKEKGGGEPSDRKKGKRVEKKRGEESGRNRSTVRDREANREGPFLPLERRLQKRLGERSNGHVTSRTTVAAASERSTFFNEAMDDNGDDDNDGNSNNNNDNDKQTRTIDFHRKRGHSHDDAA